MFSISWIVIFYFGLNLSLIPVLTLQIGDALGVKAKMHASNLVSVTLNIHPNIQDLSEVNAVFVLERGSRKVPHTAVSHLDASNPATELKYSLWLHEPLIAPVDLTLDTHVTLDFEDSRSMSRAINVTSLPNVHPPKLLGLTWNEEEDLGCSNEPMKTRVCAIDDCDVAPQEFYVIQEYLNARMYKLGCLVENNLLADTTMVTWYQDNIPINSDEYIITADEVSRKIAIKPKSAGIFRCIASNRHSAISASHAVHIQETHWRSASREQMQEPVNVTRTKNGYVKLTCDSAEALANSPTPPIISWYKDGDMISGEKRMIEFEDTGVLIIKQLSTRDTGVYGCGIESCELAQEKVLPSEYNLQVHDKKQQYEPNKEIYDQNDQILTYAGAPLTLHCAFSKGNITEWRVPDDMVTKISTGRNSLRINKVTTEHNNKQITCRSSGNAQKTFTIIVEEKPTIKLSPVFEKNEGDNVTIICDVTGTPSPSITWFINNTEQSALFNKTTWFRSDLEMKDNLEIRCRAENKWGTAERATYLMVYEKTYILDSFVSIKESRLYTHCIATTDVTTTLTIKWIITKLKNGEQIDVKNMQLREKYKIRVYNDSLSIPVADGKEYDVTCIAFNTFSEERHSFLNLGQYAAAPQTGSISQRESGIFGEDMQTIHLLSIIGGVVLLALVSMLFFFAYKCHRLRHQIKSSQSDTRSLRTTSRLNSYNDGTEEHLMPHTMVFDNAQLQLHDVNCNTAKRVRRSKCLANDPDLMSLVMEVFVDRSRLNVQEIIGKGQFGRVYKGILTDQKNDGGITIAIKTLKYKSSETDMVNLFLREAIIMKNFRHQNVLTLLGISEDSDGSPMVILPYMSRGDLRGFILNEAVEITVLDLLKLSLQVARGMAYLCAQKFVHRDLACRNCMVDENSCVKVADFGLSRDLFSQDYYRDSPGKHPLPVRWMAPECHENNVFTMNSDVWSFGVLLWELMTRGLTPYYEVENWQVPSHVMSGATLPQPEYCPDSVFEIMKSCWYREPQARSAFPEIVQQVEDIILTARTGNTYDCDRFYHNIQRPDETDYRDGPPSHTTASE